VGVMALFLTTFFFTIASTQEGKIVEKQMNFIMDDFIGGTFKSMDVEKKKDIKKYIDSALEDAKKNMKDEDEKVKKQNDATTKKAFTFVGILSGIIIMVVLIIGFYFKWEQFYVKYLFFSSLTSLIFVAIAESAFLFLIPKGYYSVDPNKIKKTIIDSLLK
jgi:hypothetical protein